MLAKDQRVTVARLAKPDRATRELMGELVGRDGVVTETREGAPFPYLVRVDGAEDEWWFRASELEEEANR